MNEYIIHQDCIPTFSKSMDQNTTRMSEFLYVGLCKKIGFPTQISIRRDILDIVEKVRFMTDTKKRGMVSGSRREGFDLPTSDLDHMIWRTDHKVICDIRQSENYRSTGTTLILMECTEQRPGFALLQLLTPSYNRFFVAGRFNWNYGIYISSSKFRNTAAQRSPYPCFIHGPCATARSGNIEFDIAYCFACTHWPSPANSWIERCRRNAWPSSQVIQDIVYNGCHLVPIGSKNSPLEDHEWRISFSQAEQKLVYSMNHVQFLCYGLLKLFLKEVMNVSLENPPLCSYFMKTVVFWEIQEKQNQTWTPDNILIHFWQCFKHIIQWVQRGECPNFFIPSYNMFYGKVEGSVQYLLLTKLQNLYSAGLSCLLHCESIRLHLNNAICNPTLSVGKDEMYFVHETDVDRELYANISKYVDGNAFPSSLIFKSIETIKTLAQSPHSRYQTIVLQTCYSQTLKQLIVYLQNTQPSTNNKHSYDLDRLSCHLLKLAAKFGNISDLLYISMYHYRIHRHSMALHYAELAKHKLSRPYLWYLGQVNSEMYSEAVGGMSLSKKMREAVASSVILNNGECYIDELKLEQKISKSNHKPILYIPPFVLVNMLTVLCSRGDPHKQLEALHDLHTLLTNDHDRIYIADLITDISWQILGICYQSCGDVYNALQAYQQSLNQHPFNEIQEASYVRICCLMEAHGDSS